MGGNIGWIRNYGKAVFGSSCVARAALQLHSIKRRSRCTAVFPGVSVLSKPTPALSKCLKLKCRVTSQAGRRGFEPRLPLHRINNLEQSEIASRGKRVLNRGQDVDICLELPKWNASQKHSRLRTSSPDGNDQLSACVPGFEVTDSLWHFAQLVAALYDRSHLPGFDEILQHQQVRPRWASPAGFQASARRSKAVGRGTALRSVGGLTHHSSRTDRWESARVCSPKSTCRH